MWLLKFHIAFSILCVITFYGFGKVFKQQLKQNGWLGEKKKKKISSLLFFFVPIMNVICVFVLFVTICIKKEDLEAYTDYAKKESEE